MSLPIFPTPGIRWCDLYRFFASARLLGGFWPMDRPGFVVCICCDEHRIFSWSHVGAANHGGTDGTCCTVLSRRYGTGEHRWELRNGLVDENWSSCGSLHLGVLGSSASL